MMLIEDNEHDVQLVAKAIKSLNLDIKLLVYSSAIEAQKYLTDNKHEAKNLPKLILLDLSLPEKSGTELLTEIKQTPLLKQIPILALTNATTLGSRLDCYDQHINAYLHKPQGYNEMLELIKQTYNFWFCLVEAPVYKIL